MAELAVISQDFCSLPELQTQSNRPINFKSTPPLVAAQYILGPFTTDMPFLNYTYGFLRKLSTSETRVGSLKITKQTSFTDGTPQVVLPEAHLDMDNNRIINLGDADMGGPLVNSQGVPHHGVNLRVGDQRYLRKESWSPDPARTMAADLIFNNNLTIKTNAVNGILTITSSSTPTSNNAKIILNSGNGTIEAVSSDNVNIKSNFIVDGTTTLKNSINFTTGNANAQEKRIQNLRRLNSGSEYTGTDYDNDPMTIGDVKAYVFVKGMVIMWAGPVQDNFDETGLGINTLKGWALCNGATHVVGSVSTVTPDLRDRFIIGAHSFTDSKWQSRVTGSPLQTGGSKNAVIVRHNHSVTEGAHSHTITDPGHTHTYHRAIGTVGGTGHAGRTATDFPQTGRQVTGITIDESGAHTHTVSEVGEDGTNKNLPPFYALAYIIRL